MEGLWGLEPIPADTLREVTGRHRADTQRQTAIHPHSQTYGGLFVLWEEAGAPEANKMWTEYKTVLLIRQNFDI